MLDDFSQQDNDGGSLGRLTVSTVMAAILFSGLLAAVLLAPAPVEEIVEEELAVNVEFPDEEEEVPEPEPEPEPEPLPEPAVQPPPDQPPEPMAAMRRGEELRPEVESVDEIPDDAPEESEGELEEERVFNPETEGSPDGVEGGTRVTGPPGGTPGGTRVAPPPPPPPPPRARRGPVRMPSNATPPDCAGQPQPDVGEAIRGAGLSSVRVIMRLTFDVRGRVTGAQVLRGHELVPDANLVRGFRRWNCEPAKLPNGEAIAVVRTLPVNIDIR
ncbi:MAG: energy transducer TonB [Sandaracinaceae bacterium]